MIPDTATIVFARFFAMIHKIVPRYLPVILSQLFIFIIVLMNISFINTEVSCYILVMENKDVLLDEVETTTSNRCRTSRNGFYYTTLA